MADMADFSICSHKIADDPPTDITLEGAWALPKEFDWCEIQHNETIGFVSFRKGLDEDEERLVIYYENGTVLSISYHEKHESEDGPSKMFRMHGDAQLIRKLFINLREHSCLGYFTPYEKLERLKEQSWNFPSVNFTREYFIHNIDEEMVKLAQLKWNLIAKTDAGKEEKNEKDIAGEIEPVDIDQINSVKWWTKKGSARGWAQKNMDGNCIL